MSKKKVKKMNEKLAIKLMICCSMFAMVFGMILETFFPGLFMSIAPVLVFVFIGTCFYLSIC